MPLFDRPPHGTNCAPCPKSSSFGDGPKSDNPASTRCFWCLKFLCSTHAHAPFGWDLQIRACERCHDIIGDAYTMLGGISRLTVPKMWVAMYGSR